jgi:demethylmenaquinone methyltransferase/2-methoxy-6-polyprenyl-1,4-benzoquinol methylase
VLEVGAGTGHCVETLARAVGEDGLVHAIDLSEGMLRQARERIEKQDLTARVDLRQGDAAKLPYDDGSMDAVFMSFTLELFDTPEIPVVLAECRRVLRPGGRIVVVGMSQGEPGDPLVKLYEWTHQHFPNFVDCRPISVRDTITEAGFVIDDAETVHMWVPVEIVLAHVDK